MNVSSHRAEPRISRALPALRARRAAAWCVAITLLLGALLVSHSPAAGAAKKKDRPGDHSWLRPDYASFPIERIAMLPVASYENDLAAEKKVEGVVSQSLGTSGYRWISPATARELLRSEARSDSLLAVLDRQVLQGGRVDSTSAPRLCARLRCRGVLTVRIDRWEKRELEWNEAGRPSTSVRLTAALVDSTGALLWTVTSEENVDGAYREAGRVVMSPNGGDLASRPNTVTSGAPDFVEVASVIGKRWSSIFPSLAVSAAADTSRTPPVR